LWLVNVQLHFQSDAGDGVNALDKKHPVERFHAGIAGLSPLRRGKHWHANAEIWGVMLDEGFDPRALMDSQPIKFTKSMEGALSRDQ
jgi:hypothetical protein